jgi:arginyl-tRNA synthetase
VSRSAAADPAAGIPVGSPRQAMAEYLARPVERWLREQATGGELDAATLAAALDLQRPARSEHGDLATNLALRLARPLRRPPLEIARELAAAIPAGGPLASAEAAPPGFVNLRLDPAWLFESLRAVVEAGGGWGRSDLGRGERVLVEFVSTNPTGPLLFSHGRGAVVGDVVARLLGATGHLVHREFYVNDAGRQVRVFAESLLAARLGRPAPPDGYSGEYIQELAQAMPEELWADIPAEIRERDEPWLPLGSGPEPHPLGDRVGRVAAWGVKHYLEEDRRDLDAMDIRFDRWYHETELETASVTAGARPEPGTLTAAQATHALLQERGAIAEHDGAVWLVLPDGHEEVLYKSSGAATYFWGDLVYHRDKLVTRGFDRAIDVWGADHQNQVRRLKEALTLFDVDPARFQVILIQLVHMRSAGGFVKISKRKGNIVMLRDLVEEVGADAVRYHYLLRSNDATMDFDLDLARQQSNENPVFYAQYAHARLCSVRAVGREAGIEPDPGALHRLGAAGEVELAKELLELPDVVELAATELAPHHLTHYAQRLAEKVHSFYHAGNRDGALRVVVEDRELSAARLHLCEAARLTMANLLGLMGVSAPERM